MVFYMHDIDGKIITLFRTLNEALKKFNKEDRRETVSLLSSQEDGSFVKTVLFSWKYEKSVSNIMKTRMCSRIERLQRQCTNDSEITLYGLFLEQDKFNLVEEFWVQHIFFTTENQRLIYSLSLMDLDPHWFTVEVGEQINILYDVHRYDNKIMNSDSEILLITEK